MIRAMLRVLVFFMATLVASGIVADNPLTFKILRQNSTHAQMLCRYEGHAHSYFTISNNGKKIETKENSPAINFTVESPRCGQKSNTITCNSQNGEHYDKSIYVMAKPDIPIITINKEGTVHENEIVEVQCHVDNLCTKEKVDFELDFNYHLRKPKITYSGGEAPYSGSAVTTVHFSTPGEHVIRCKAESGEFFASKNVTVLASSKNNTERVLTQKPVSTTSEPAINTETSADKSITQKPVYTASKPVITITTKGPFKTNEEIFIKCQVKTMNRQQQVIFEPQIDYHLKKGDITYYRNDELSATLNTTAIFLKPGEYELICAVVESGILSKHKVQVKESDISSKHKGHFSKQISGASTLHPEWRVPIAFAIIFTINFILR